MRVAAGAIARLVLGADVQHPRRAGADGAGPRSTAPAGTGTEVGRNPFFCPDPVAAASWETMLAAIRKAGSSVGAVIEIVAEGVPPGLGAPIYGKLDADLASALMGINAVKGVEIGDGFAAAALRGEDNADEMRMRGRRGPLRLATMPAASWAASAPASPIVARFAVKPTSSIL